MEWVKQVRNQIPTQEWFKRLVDQWVDLSIVYSRLTIRIAEHKSTR